MTGEDRRQLWGWAPYGRAFADLWIIPDGAEPLPMDTRGYPAAELRAYHGRQSEEPSLAALAQAKVRLTNQGRYFHPWVALLTVRPSSRLVYPPGTDPVTEAQDAESGHAIADGIAFTPKLEIAVTGLRELPEVIASLRERTYYVGHETGPSRQMTSKRARDQRRDAEKALDDFTFGDLRKVTTLDDYEIALRQWASDAAPVDDTGLDIRHLFAS